NVALKLNIRLGNVNHVLSAPTYKDLALSSELDTIILGADVIHPGAGATKGTPSIAAVVGSVHEHFAEYFGSMRRQNREIIEDEKMQAMVVERLNAWAKLHDGRYPTNIIYYRDGVGDSQIRKLRTTEIPQIRYSFEQKCKVTAVVVTKRHNLRIYPDPKAGEAGKIETSTSGNCQAGTVVDHAITTPYHFDFYLVSHHGIQGTSRPAHYFVVENDLNLSMTALQDFTFALCHLYQRITTSVGYATPAYYADHLCERGRAYV
ncbi:stem cell self-renewal protein Piwi, partial [Teratosphaeria nubilosa]